MKNFKENNKGFSLVELIVVIAIMVVLIAVLGSTILGYVDKSKYSKDISALDSVNTAVKTFVADPNSNYTDGYYTLAALASDTVDKGKVIKPILAEVFKSDGDFNNASKAFASTTMETVYVNIYKGAVSVYVSAGSDFEPYLAGLAFTSEGGTTAAPQQNGN